VSRAKGEKAEERACHFLQEAGFCIEARNFYARFGELDIVASKDGVLHFIEVKSGRSYEEALQNLTPKKLARVIKTAQLYQKKHNTAEEFCIDAIIVTPLEIEHLQNITL